MSEQTVTLKSGAVEFRPAVEIIMGMLQDMNNSLPGALAFHDLVMRCRDKSYPIAVAQLETLEATSLMTNGWIHETVRAVVLSGVEGDGIDMKLVSPYAAQE